MNKSYRYLSLILVAGLFTGAHAMEEEGQALEGPVDKYAILKREFNTDQQNALMDIVEKHQDSENVKELAIAYNAVVKLDIDEPTTARDPKFIKLSNEFWSEIVKKSPNKEVALELVNYLPCDGDAAHSKEGKELFKAMAARVLRRNDHMKAQDTRTSMLTSQLKKAQDKEEKQSQIIAKLTAVARSIAQKKANEIAELKQKIKRLEKERYKALFAHSQKEATIREEQKETQKEQTSIKGKISLLEEAKETAGKDKAKLLATFEEMIEIGTSKKTELEKQIADLQTELENEVIDTEQDVIRAECNKLKVQLKELKQNIGYAKKAKAEAEDTNPKLTNLFGLL